VNCRGYSLPLQRVITDFGADIAFGQIPQKLLEHHGISVPISSAQKITESHALRMLKSQNLEAEIPLGAARACLIAEIDGSMVPIVETQPHELDRRKTRKLKWQEARLAAVRSPEQAEPIFSATLGSTDTVGAQLLDIAIKAGLGVDTFVHAVGDGAPWIASQVDARFGEPSRYLLDFYHLCEYLAAASHVCAPLNPKAWMDEQKLCLKNNCSDTVLATLKLHREPDTVPDPQAPVRAAYRYIFNRPQQLDYKSAIASGLPIGSGEIESAHRYIIQHRLKLSGCWWTVKNAEAMLALRVVRANQNWHEYWSHSTA
jgi:hypothetical protein